MGPSPYSLTVVDTNVLLSAALLQASVPAQVVDSLLANYVLVFSAATFVEFENRLWRPKFDRYISNELRSQILIDLKASARWVDSIKPEICEQVFSRDANDDMFIHAALACGARRLVTGDADLLSLAPLRDLRIVTPRQALNELNKLLTSG